MEIVVLDEAYLPTSASRLSSSLDQYIETPVLVYIEPHGRLGVLDFV
jgi:hypothetical protein